MQKVRPSLISTVFKPSACFFLGCTLLVANKSDVSAGESKLDGRQVYRQNCTKCHGKNGEGVKGKYDDTLVGDWSLEKLTRYIDKNMPDDDPGKCKGPEAEAVARYINDAFYSREARARNHPARIELVRLTNKQYLNTIADLLKSFTGKDDAPTGEHGLRATYYRNKDFGSKAFDRIDKNINFDFGKGGPEEGKSGTNGFSMQWRGSLIADETGDYEFLLKTPNGARLWLNNNEDPIIDAWVASGQLTEHKANLHLIGGRMYPLRLDYFKFKDKTASIALHWKPPHGAEGPIPARQFLTSRVSPTYVLGTPFPPDDSSVGYERGVSVSKAWDEAATQAAIEVANFVSKQIDRLAHTKPTATNRTEKVEAFCEQFVSAAFRRPLNAELSKSYIAAQFKHAPKLEDAVKRVVLLTLKSPRFLYLGLEKSKPDDYEIASRLAYDLWDSLPDADIIKSARDGKLHTEEAVFAQARRMLEDPRAHAKIRGFLHHWLHVDHVEDVSKDPKLFPGFSAEIISDLRTSLDLFLDDVIWSPSSDYRKLLLADYLFLNNRLSSFYGISTNSSDDFVKVPLSPKERSGVVTHPYLLAAFSYQKSTSPIHRGVFLTRNIIGRSLKPPPMAMTFKDADFAPNLTMREKIAQLTRPQACQGCHSVINPLGFSLEKYDAVGRFRTLENDKPIDVSSDYTTSEGDTVHLTGARDVAEFAASSEQAQTAFIEQLFHSVVKQPISAYGSQVMGRLRQSFAASGYNVQKLLVEMATISALHDIQKNSPAKPSTSRVLASSSDGKNSNR